MYRILMLSLLVAACKPDGAGPSGKSIQETKVDDQGNTITLVQLQFDEPTLHGYLSDESAFDVKASAFDEAGEALKYADGSDFFKVTQDNYFWFDSRRTPRQLSLLKFEVPEGTKKWKLDFVNIAGRTCAPSPAEGSMVDIYQADKLLLTEKEGDAESDDTSVLETLDKSQFTVKGNCTVKYDLSGTATGLTEEVTLLVNGKDEITITKDEEGKGTFTYTVEVDPLQGVQDASQDKLSPDAAFENRASAKLIQDGYAPVKKIFRNAAYKFSMKDAESPCQVTNGEKLLEKQIIFFTSEGATPNYRKLVSPSLVSDIVVNCQPTTYRIGGTVSGLGSGKSVKLRDFDQPTATKFVTVTADGSFQFPGTRAAGYEYQVDVIVQPAGQTCTSTNDLDTVAGNVTNITVTCVDLSPTYSVGGTVTGLVFGDLVTLQLTYGATPMTTTTEDFIVSFNPIIDPSPFDFLADLANGDDYSVAIEDQPANVTCSVDSGGSVGDGSGTISSASVTDITISCVP